MEGNARHATDISCGVGQGLIVPVCGVHSPVLDPSTGPNEPTGDALRVRPYWLVTTQCCVRSRVGRVHRLLHKHSVLPLGGKKRSPLLRDVLHVAGFCWLSTGPKPPLPSAPTVWFNINGTHATAPPTHGTHARTERRKLPSTPPNKKDGGRECTQPRVRDTRAHWKLPSFSGPYNQGFGKDSLFLETGARGF